MDERERKRQQHIDLLERIENRKLADLRAAIIEQERNAEYGARIGDGDREEMT